MQVSNETNTVTQQADNQSQVQADTEQANSSKRQKSRHRASVACATCRERRIRCVVPEGESECVQCKRSGTECVIKNDDERRRPISRAYMSTLTDRVQLLESMLKDRGAEPPPVTYPPKTTRGNLNANEETSPSRLPASVSVNQDSASHETSSPGSFADEGMETLHAPPSIGSQREDIEANQGTPILENKKEGLVSRLLSTRGHLSFDQLSGRLRYFGPTTNCHIYSELDVDDSRSGRETVEQTRRAEKIIRSLPLETQEYLLQLFWQHYNSVLHVVHQEAFYEDREQGRNQFYSGFLHICVLAMGFRISDKSRPDMQRIALPDRESTLHREAKYMLDLELERPGGVPSVAALLILGDLENGVGRDNVGWMYAGMAVRLCFDIGLHLDSRNTGLSQREIDIRTMTLWACVVYDRYWALFLGRPTSMKSSDLEIYSLSKQFERLGTCKPAGPQKSLETRIYEALLDLMEIAGQITENTEHRSHHESAAHPDQSSYFRMAALDRELHKWYTRLPQDLKYIEENRASAPFSFYLLHQQYHAILILLHRPFARYDDPNSPETEDVTALDNHFSQASRAICTKSAVAISRIFWAHRQRYDTRLIFCVGMQHAGVAATALIAALAYIPDAADRSNNMQYLEVLAAALQDMADQQQPAQRMSIVLNAVMVELRGGPLSPGKSATSTSSVIPARRESTVQEVERPTVKRRHTANRPPKSKNLNPPPSRTHRASDASVDFSVAGQQRPHDVDFVMVTPRTEGSSWPNVHGTDSFQDQGVLPTPMTSMNTSPGRRGGWMNGEAENELAQMQAMNDLHSMPSGNMTSLDFLTLPSEDDWTRWHSGPSDITTDLDGFPPRGRFNNNDFASPPMGGIMNG